MWGARLNNERRRGFGESPMKNILSIFRAIVLSLFVVCSAPAKSEAQSYGSVAEYWTFACTSGLNTNIFDVLNDIFAELGNIQGLTIDLDSILNFEFNPFEMQGCNLPNINFGGIPSIQVDGLFSCFGSLPNLSGLFGNMANCVSGVLGQFPSLANLLQGVDFSSVFNCMINVSTPNLPTLSVGDIIGGLLDKISAIMELLGSIEMQLPNLRKLVEWTLQICQTMQSGGAVGGAMAGASIASSSSMVNGVAQIGVTINPNAFGAGGPGSGTSGGQVAAAAKAPRGYLVISTKRKVRSSDIRGRKKKGVFLKMFPLKKVGPNRYSAVVKTKDLPAGATYNSTIYMHSARDGVVFVPGPLTKLKR